MRSSSAVSLVTRMTSDHCACAVRTNAGNVKLPAFFCLCGSRLFVAVWMKWEFAYLYLIFDFIALSESRQGLIDMDG